MTHQHALTINSSDGILRVLKSQVGISLPSVNATEPDATESKVISFIGVWDTGATGTAISKKVVSALNLKPTGQTDVHTANDKITTNTYLVDIYLPMNVKILGVKVTEGKLSPDTDLLIGMDIITLGDFSITHRDGKTKMSFGIPSIESHDFAERIHNSNNKIKAKNEAIVGNQKCSCGSGRKYRYCHGKPVKV